MTDGDDIYGLALDGYRFEDLKAAKIVSSRGDLNRKQKTLGFPRPVKTGERAAWFPGPEVRAWLKQRALLRRQSAAAPHDTSLPVKTCSGKGRRPRARASPAD